MSEPPIPEPGSLEFYLAAYFGFTLLAGVGLLVWLLVEGWQRRSMLRLNLRPWFLGWVDFGLLICILVAWAMIASSLVAIVMPLPEEPTADQMIWQTVLATLISQAGFLVLFMGFRTFLPFAQRVPLSQDFLPLRPAFINAIVGILASLPPIWGLTIGWGWLVKWVGTEFGIGVPDAPQMMVSYLHDVESPFAFTALMLLAVVVAPVTEELIFRAGIYRFLKSRLSPGVAIVLSSALFGSIHVHLLSFPSLMLLGGILCLAYELTGSLRVPVLIHALFNLNTTLLIVLQPTLG